MTGKKIVLDLDPQGPITFTRGVKIPTGDGKPLEIEFEFLFRDSVEYGKLVDSWRGTNESRLVAVAADEALPVERRKSSADWAEAAVQENTANLMDFLCGWNIKDFEFNAENLSKFVRRYPGAFLILLRDYRDGMTEGRLGN
jgi:hypothetical protein